MRVLWISNTIFPDACVELGIKPQVKEGWAVSSANALFDLNTDLRIAVASLYSGNDLKIIDKYKFKYYLIPIWPDDQYYDKKKETYYREVIKDYNPDIVHIHGTEYPHSLACAKACGEIPFVISIQGLVSTCWKYLNGGLSDYDIKDEISIKQNLKEKIKSILGMSLKKTAQEEMKIRGIYETELIRQTKNVIGRTSWDKSVIWEINPSANYFFCNETLRPVFYDKQWTYETCEKHSIFVSQGNYPLKGLHKVIESLPLVLRDFPDTILYVGGHDILNDPQYKNYGYAKYIKSIISKLNIEKKIKFLGFLDEEQMSVQFEKSHVFVSPSSIENSPNSVGEAQLVGTPCIGSYVGGTMDMIKDEETGLLYRFEEIAMLATKICDLFKDEEKCKSISYLAKEEATRRHNRENNALNLLNIYSTILNQ